MEFHPVFYSSDADEALIGNQVRPDLIAEQERNHDPTKGLLLEINKPNEETSVFIPTNEKRSKGNLKELNKDIKKINANVDLDNGEVEGFSNNNNLNIYKNLAIIVILLFIFFILLSD